LLETAQDFNCKSSSESIRTPRSNPSPATNMQKELERQNKTQLTFPKLEVDHRRIQFVPTCVATLTERHGLFGVLEPFLEGSYQEFNNSLGWADKRYKIAQAFSHWSFNVSDNQSLVIDLQGVGEFICKLPCIVILISKTYQCLQTKVGRERTFLILSLFAGNIYTNPEIHMAGSRSERTGILGEHGFRAFIDNHVCSDICEGCSYSCAFVVCAPSL
jgi:hypothetical protein